ncbi:Trafficking protein particle complex subunit 11 [Acropora cervicornis]|uniref:Trafficking protein particle complex subunit 11 n=1 Tax=Acropora cervicornis TaxID=6130 RepID=A0AAD9R7G7_ACRCE|nr:Trafficking protein particle complex subunit 11 [Acropora cervicornis]
MAAASEFPNELATRPLGLVALMGLSITQKPLHKAIWESFSVNRHPDRVPLSFRLLPIDHEFPKAKSKGVLKTKWMHKHLYLTPAVVVMFYELDWDDAQSGLQDQNTKVAVVLIQKNAPLPPGDDLQALERAATLCSACDLSAKSLFVLPHTDHLIGYTIRLENAFYDLSQSYYHGECRRVKAHKEFLNKGTHQFLLVRHQFKVAFFNELRQDPHSAIKHYRQAYNLLGEIKTTDINILEIKVVAGFISYKICRLSFQASAPLDAISQFRKHVDLFKEKVGCPELAFEHSAWLSKQFSLFGELFDEAIRNGLTALQTTTPLSMNPLDNAGNLDFFGQRPWRQGFQGTEPPDAALEHAGIIALQSQELQVDHSWIIIPLLSSAVAQFKKYKSPRMKRYLNAENSPEEKTRCQTNLIQVMANECPEPEPGCDFEAVEEAKEQWKTLKATPEAPQVFTIQMEQIAPFDSTILLQIYLRVTCTFPIRFSKISVFLSNQLVPQPEDVGKQLQVTSIALELGSLESRCAVLVWNGGGVEASASSNKSFVSYGSKSAAKEDQFDWDDLQIVSKIKIEPRKSRINVELKYEPPALVNEFYELQVWLGFHDEQEPTDNTALICCEVPTAEQPQGQTPSFTEFRVEEFDGKIVYSVDVEVKPSKKSVTCTCVKLERLDQVFEEEPFLLLAGIKCTSPWPVTMVNTILNMSPEVNFVGEAMSSQLQGVSLQQGESASECYCLEVKPDVSKLKVVNIGSLSLQWRRTSALESFPVVVTELTFPSVTVESVPFTIQTDLPAYGCVQMPLNVSYLVRNRTFQVQEVEVNVEPSDAFMYSGHKQVSWDEQAQKMIPSNVFIKPKGHDLSL